VKKITTIVKPDHVRKFLATPADLDRLAALLHTLEYETIGPVCRDNAIVFAPVTDIGAFPAGWSDEQAGGRYRLDHTSSPSLFAYTVGPQSLKKYLYPANQTFLTVSVENGRMEPQHQSMVVSKQAFFGVRACDLAALAVLDKVLLDGPYVDSGYAARRAALKVIAVNCTRPGGTCFCGSMGTGPMANDGCDLSLTEILARREHYFVVSAHTDFGRQIVTQLALEPATAEQADEEASQLSAAAEKMGKSLDPTDLPKILADSFDDRHWDDIAARCLTCGNCTMVCPTCFCTDIIDTTDLAGARAERSRQWDSCHTVGFSYIHGGSIRSGEAARYRQWMMHKLSYWPEQFGTFGCVGCGRCITWCPVGIDITEEAGIFRKHITG
jgi:ferredoxin